MRDKSVGGPNALHGSCHCGAVQFTVAGPPDHLVDCNCSICRRNGALWAFYEPSAVGFKGHPVNTVPYVWGKRSIRTMHCAICGCSTHWEPLDATAGRKWGINMRNFEPAAVAGVRVRRFDGAATWTYFAE